VPLFPIVAAIKMTVPEYEIDVLYRLFREWISIESGRIATPHMPGRGVVLDEAAIARYQVDERRVAVP